MVPHDQQLGVTSPGPCPGMINDPDDLDSMFAIQRLPYKILGERSARPLINYCVVTSLWPERTGRAPVSTRSTRTNCRNRTTWSSLDSRTRIPAASEFPGNRESTRADR